MKGREESHMDKYKEVTNNWNYDASYVLTSLPVLSSEDFFKCLIFFAWSVHGSCCSLDICQDSSLQLVGFLAVLQKHCYEA
jgi:hypothetical protein